MITFLTQALFFLFASLSCFVIPGNLIWQKTKLRADIWENLIFSTNIGFTFFTLLSYLLLYFRIDFIILPLAILINLYWLKSNFSSSFLSKPTKISFLTLSVFAIGILGQLLVISPSGTYFNGDIVFWSSHGHDASWHIALAEEIKRGAPWQNPTFAGEKLINYHFFSDVSLAILSKYFNLSSIELYFRFFPLMYSILLGGSVFYLTKKLTNSFSSSLWAAFFTYFCGSFGFLITFFRDGKLLGGESIFGSSQIQSTIGNPPQICAFIILLSFLYFFAHFLEKKSKYLFFILILFASVLIVFKVYAGVILLGCLFLVGLWQVIREKKFSIILIFICSSLASAIFYLPNTSNSASFLIWEPWWYIRTLSVHSNKLNWLDIELRRQTYLAENNFKRVISIELMLFFLFLIGNLGMRFLGFFSSLKILLLSFKNYLNLLLILICLTSFIFPMLFLQKGVAGNTIQFFQYFLLILGILAGITVSNLLKKINSYILKIIVIFLIVILSIPTQVGLLVDFYSRAPIAKIEKNELAALEFLKENSKSDSIILTAPYNKFLNLNLSTPPIWAWFDTAYVSAFSARRSFLADTEQVDIMGYKLNERLEIQKNIFEVIDESVKLKEEIRKVNIDYIYFPKALKPKVDLSKLDFTKIYDNGNIEIWDVN